MAELPGVRTDAMGETADIVALALDQSPAATGWAVGRPNGTKAEFGTYRLPPWKDEEGARLAAFVSWLSKLVTDYRVTHIYYESPFLPSHSNANAIKPQLFLIGVVNLVAAQHSLNIAEVPIDAWRKWAFGYCRLPMFKGDAARKEWKRMAKVMCLKRNHRVEDDNAAEALLILDYGLSDADRGHRRQSEVRHRRAELSHWMSDKR